MQPRELFRIDGPLLCGRLVSRPNRFTVKLDAEKGQTKCHLHDPGRLGELLLPGAELLYRGMASEGRKT